MAYVITEPCIDMMDLACIEECPVDCIYQGKSMSYVHPAECVDCGACEPVCPVEAIFYEHDVPEEQRRFIEIGRDFSTIVEGGGARNKRYSYDSPLISDSMSQPIEAAVRGGDGSFLSNPSGMSIAAVWASSGITASGLKMLLLFFDKVAVISDAEDSSVAQRWSEFGGLISHLRIADLLAHAGDDTLRALYEATDDMPTGRPVSSSANAARKLLHRAFAGVITDTSPLDVARRINSLSDVRCYEVKLALDEIARQTLALRGTVLRYVTGNLYWPSRSRRQPVLGGARHGGLAFLPPEWIGPECAAATVSELLAFRDAHGSAFRQHLHLMEQTVMSLGDVTTESIASAILSPDHISDSATELRRRSRTCPWNSAGYGGVGLAFDGLGPPLATPNDIRRLYAHEAKQPPEAITPILTVALSSPAESQVFGG